MGALSRSGSARVSKEIRPPAVGCPAEGEGDNESPLSDIDDGCGGMLMDNELLPLPPPGFKGAARLGDGEGGSGWG